MNIRYILEPTQGIPLARNAGIAAVPDDAEFICFIDDDEWPGLTPDRRVAEDAARHGQVRIACTARSFRFILRRHLHGW
ncbi:MAG: glycosyltransferase family 2 protein [Desulfobacterales bacterium]|nr:glycosyltransferase family 2 protein [Desulfobacterales bacterium]